ncbi:hypothetical protein BC835DRAFT_850407 [Cytidiella melzeri]|nr:hypothetical protein BC835DRAFT_850407 [Cytidiella melzeri]
MILQGLQMQKEFNPSKDSSIFADLEYFNTMGMPMPDNNEGVFQLPAAPFLDAVPGQIDVNLLNFEASDHERDRFAAMLNDFDFSAFQAGNMSLAQNVPSEILGMPDTGAWENWGSTQEHQASTSEAMSNRNVYASHAAVQSQQSMMSETSMASEYGANEPAPGMMGTQQSSEDSMQAQQANQHEISQQGMPAMSFSPDVLADPDFQAMFARYLEQKHQQSQQHGNNTQQTSHYTQQLPIEQIRQPQPQYSQQPLQYQPQYASKAPQQMQYDAHEYAEQQHAQTHHGHTSSGPSTPAAASASQHTGRYVPPAGAMRARARRVAGSWRPPAAVQQETWSAPQTPVDCAAGSRLPSWAGVPN